LRCNQLTADLSGAKPVAAVQTPPNDLLRNIQHLPTGTLKSISVQKAEFIYINNVPKAIHSSAQFATSAN
jgi:hypothetical protein